MKKLLMIVMIALIVPAFVFANGEQEATDSYVFAGNATWPPFEFVDENGDIVGFEVDLVYAIGDAVGKTFTYRNVPWDTLFAGLLNGQYDAIASGVTVTEERKLTIDFAEPFILQGQILVVKAADAEKYSSLESLPDGAPVGVQMGTTGDFVLDGTQVTPKRYDDIGLAIEDLINGNTVGVVCDSIIASDYVLANKNYAGKLVTVGDQFTAEEIAMGVKKGNTELLNLINEGYQILVENGTVDELKAKWNLI